MANIQISLDKFSFIKSETITFQISSEQASLYTAAGFEIYECGLVCPEVAYASSRIIESTEEKFEINIDTNDLNHGVFELRRVIFQSPRGDQNQPADANVVFFGGRDYPRVIFEVTASGQKPRSKEEIEAEVQTRERAVEMDFISGFDISTDPTTATEYSIFVFMSGVLITQRMRFDKWEVLPFRGLDGKDVLEAVNEFLATKTKINVGFQYTPEHSKRVRNENPMLVANFVRIVSNSINDALRHCYTESQHLADILSIRRGGSARILGAVVIDKNTTSAQFAPYIIPYRGNLIGGFISGENPKAINTRLGKLRSKPLLKYLSTSYKEAVAETNSDFEYLRYWQVLETLAESKNYNPQDDLLDFSGKPILDKSGKPMKVKDAKPIVYNLIRSHMQLGEYAEPGNFSSSAAVNYDLWQYVRVWHAMRNATAHFGGFRYGDPLQQQRLRDYEVCKQAYEDRGGSQFDLVLHQLEDITKIVLEIELHIKP